MAQRKQEHSHKCVNSHYTSMELRILTTAYTFTPIIRNICIGPFYPTGVFWTALPYKISAKSDDFLSYCFRGIAAKLEIITKFHTKYSEIKLSLPNLKMVYFDLWVVPVSINNFQEFVTSVIKYTISKLKVWISRWTNRFIKLRATISFAKHIFIWFRLSKTCLLYGTY